VWVHSASGSPAYEPGFLFPTTERSTAAMVISNETKWFVSFEALGGRRRALRETKIFSNEEEARLYAKELVLADRKNVMAGTFLSPDQATRRLISGPELHRWIGATA
jgi:hypothetical protein